MKSKLYLLSYAFFFCMLNYCQAQIKKGTSLLGGSVYFNSQKTESNDFSRSDKSNSYGFSPSYGKAIRQNLILGGDLMLSGNSITSSEQSWQSKRRENHYGAGIFLRKYQHLGLSGFYLFLQSRLGGSIMTGKGRYDPNNSSLDTKISGFNVQLDLYPGIAYAVTPRLQLETGLNNLLHAGYYSRKITNAASGAATSKTSGFGAGASIGAGVDLTVGLRLLLAKK